MTRKRVRFKNPRPDWMPETVRASWNGGTLDLCPELGREQIRRKRIEAKKDRSGKLKKRS